MFRGYYEDAAKKREICSKLTIKILEQWKNLFKVNEKNSVKCVKTSTMCKICSELTLKTTKQCVEFVQD